MGGQDATSTVVSEMDADCNSRGYSTHPAANHLRRRLKRVPDAPPSPNEEAQVNLPNVNGTRARVAVWSQLGDRQPAYALVSNVDLVVIRFDHGVAVLYGRCHHRGALLADGHIDGQNLICGVHGWDYRYDTGVSEYNNDEALHRFSAVIDEEADAVWVDEVAAFAEAHPQPYRR